MNLDGNPTRNRIGKASFWSIGAPATKLSSDILGLSGFDKNESAKYVTLFQIKNATAVSRSNLSKLVQMYTATKPLQPGLE